jgi:hypothetical protein
LLPRPLSRRPQVVDVERFDVVLDAVLAAQSLKEFVQTLNNSLTP